MFLHCQNLTIMSKWLDTTHTTTENGAIHTRWNYQNDSEEDDTTSLIEEWAASESERLEYLEKNKYLEEVVIPNLRERMQIQANHIVEARDALQNAKDRIALLENGVKRSRKARRDTSALRKENKKLKTEIIKAQRWSEDMGENVYNCVEEKRISTEQFNYYIQKLETRIQNLEFELNKKPCKFDSQNNFIEVNSSDF